MIELHQLTKRYRSVGAVEAISTVIAAGSVTGLLGPPEPLSSDLNGTSCAFPTRLGGPPAWRAQRR